MGYMYINVDTCMEEEYDSRYDMILMYDIENNMGKLLIITPFMQKSLQSTSY